MPSTTIKYFKKYPDHLMGIENFKGFNYPDYQCSLLAHCMERMIPDGPEKSAGMRKLLEAKDCFERAYYSEKEE